MKKFSLNAVQRALRDAKMQGWFFCDFMRSDPIGRSILNIKSDTIDTRRWYYYIPVQGAPKKLVHGIESKILDHLPGNKEVYIGWIEMINMMKSFFKGGEKVAIQYSHQNMIPTISKVDAGTYELLQSFRLKLISSGDLVQQFATCLNQAQMNTHINVASEISGIMDNTCRFIARKINRHQEITELSVQNFIQNQLQSRGLMSETIPRVATGRNTNNPRYIPDEKSNNPIHTKSLVQIAIRAKEKSAEAVYSSATWVCYIGENIPAEYVKSFNSLKNTRDFVVSFIKNAIKSGKKIQGWEVDVAARDMMAKEGLEPYYLHRTGHSLGTSFYAHAVNLDNLETRDERQIIPGLCFTIATGIYFPDYGMRSEINIHVGKKTVSLSSKSVQDKIYHIKPKI